MVVDSSILINYLRIKNKTKSPLFKFLQDDLFISAISVYEVMMGATDKTKEEYCLRLLYGLDVLNFDRIVAEKSSEIFFNLKKSNKLIGFRDLFIAATCIVNKHPLLTLNKKHFERIEGLELIHFD
jgi:tRNA(fMet)-specific endonuclease VapC